MGEKIGKLAVIVSPMSPNETYWSFYDTLKDYLPPSSFGTPKTVQPPLGAISGGNYLKKFYEDVKVIDRNVNPYPLEDLLKGATHVYVSGWHIHVKDAVHILKKANDMGIPTIGTGCMVSEESPVFNVAKHLIEGEAEDVIDDLLEGLADGNAEKLYRFNSFPDPSKWFTPDYSLINVNDYIIMGMQTARGCPHNCEFCDVTVINGEVIRELSFEKVKEGLLQLKSLGWMKGLFIVDDNFNGQPGNRMRWLEKLIKFEDEIDYHLSKSTQVSELLALQKPSMEKFRYLLRQANFQGLFIGVESTNEASLKETNKVQNLNSNLTTTQKLRLITKETGAPVPYGMITGFDNDEPQTIKEMEDFINQTDSARVMPSVLSAGERTKLTKRLKKEGRLRTLNQGNNSDGNVNFIPMNFSAKQAQIDYVQLMKNIYSPKAYFSRQFRELETTNPVRYDSTVDPKEAITSVRKIMTGKHSLTFWRYLPRALYIATKRYKIFSDGWMNIISENFSGDAKYRHLWGQTERLDNKLQERLANDDFESWERYSWKEIEQSPVNEFYVTNRVKDSHDSLDDQVQFTLQNGYVFEGNRMGAIKHFIGLHIREASEKVTKKNMPVEELIALETSAYKMAHQSNPQILGNINFSDVEDFIWKEIHEYKGYKKIPVHKTG